jgi:hypothetical protein
VRATVTDALSRSSVDGRAGVGAGIVACVATDLDVTVVDAADASAGTGSCPNKRADGVSTAAANGARPPASVAK